MQKVVLLHKMSILRWQSDAEDARNAQDNLDKESLAGKDRLEND